MRIRLFNEMSKYPTEVSDSTEYDIVLDNPTDLSKLEIRKICDFMKGFNLKTYVKNSEITFFKSFWSRSYSDYFSDNPGILVKEPIDVSIRNLTIKFYWTTMIFVKYDIVKTDDDWFMVQFWDDVEFKFWKCDQVEGLIDFLKKDIPDRIEYWTSRTDMAFGKKKKQ